MKEGREREQGVGKERRNKKRKWFKGKLKM